MTNSEKYLNENFPEPRTLERSDLIDCYEDGYIDGVKSISDKVQQSTYMDEIDSNAWQFIEEMQLKYGRDCKVICRGISKNSFDVTPTVIIDNYLIEVILDNRMVAMCYKRRTDFNASETTCVDIGLIKNNYFNNEL